ncbi:MAG: ACT domain-containing protein [Lachnospiraceae bacterium]|nr:ACT domain-containing protein [Lachnospiraceae bacterium]
MKKTIITVVGKDTVGIIARVCTYLANNQINILDISQTIVSGYFNMMMVVDTNQCTKDFGSICEELDQAGQEIGVAIKCQKEEIFDSMHRI